MILNHVINNIFYSVPGAYIPLTMEGNIIVDGILASCYASYYHDLVHIVTAPVQWFPGAIQWIIGDDNDFIVYANIFNDLSNCIFIS